MCGICGIVNLNGQVDGKNLAAMVWALTHRGPDDEGSYFTPNEESSSSRIALGFRRLSIIDLGLGHQPMTFQNWVIVFNGEIYNYLELKRECESKGDRFKTSSDTEVLLHLYAHYGEKCLERLRGMFAFAIWDIKKRELFCARDPLGIKPFYYFWNEKKFLFSSEIRSLFASGEISLKFDPTSVLDLLRYRFVPAPHTIIKGVQKLPPAHFLKIKNGSLSIQRYWNVRKDVSIPKKESDLEYELLSRLEESVRMQMVADVPLGAFLSGGVDSSLIVALMAKDLGRKVETFSIGFEKGTGVDESQYAKKVSQYIGTNHHEYILTKKDLEATRNILSHLAEPIGDPTILPTAILSKFARQHVKVVLTGEGGDELFAGYNRYKSLLYCEWVQKLPRPLQGLAKKVLRNAGKGEIFKQIPNITTENWFPLNEDFTPEVIQRLIKNSNENLSNRSYLPSHPYFVEEQNGGLLNSILSLERETSLADRLLMKVDSASMGESLEARPPYLDPPFVEFVANLPANLKIRRFKGKYILRKIACQILPKEIVWRRKHGFIVPITQWIYHGHRESLEDLLEAFPSQLEEHFNFAFIRSLKEKIYKKEATQEEIALLWPVIVLKVWTESLKKY